MNPSEKESAEQKSMMASMDFTDVGMSMTALVQGVMQANLRAFNELSRVKNPQALVALQRRFAGEYIAALHLGMATLINAAAD